MATLHLQNLTWQRIQIGTGCVLEPKGEAECTEEMLAKFKQRPGAARFFKPGGEKIKVSPKE